MMKVLQSYLTSDGVKITVFAPAKPRANERTWTGNSKYSIFQIGRQAAKIGGGRAQATPDQKWL
jgi:hypothetical protein